MWEQPRWRWYYYCAIFIVRSFLKLATLNFNLMLLHARICCTRKSSLTFRWFFFLLAHFRAFYFDNCHMEKYIFFLLFVLLYFFFRFVDSSHKNWNSCASRRTKSTENSNGNYCTFCDLVTALAHAELIYPFNFSFFLWFGRLRYWTKKSGRESLMTQDEFCLQIKKNLRM